MYILHIECGGHGGRGGCGGCGGCGGRGGRGGCFTKPVVDLESGGLVLFKTPPTCEISTSFY